MDGECPCAKYSKEAILWNTWEIETLAVTFIKFIVFFELWFEDRCAWDSSYNASFIRCAEEM